MSKIMRTCVLVASLMSLLGVMSSSAGAVTWSNDGGTSFTATGGPVTLSSGLSMSCGGSDATGTATVGPFVGATWLAASATARFTNCNLAGIPTNIDCRYTLTATAQPSHAVTNGNLDVTCDVSQSSTRFCHFEGSTPGHYLNPPHARLIVTHSTNQVTPTNVTPGSCPLSSPMTLTQQTLTVTSANPPTITRRP